MVLLVPRTLLAVVVLAGSSAACTRHRAGPPGAAPDATPAPRPAAVTAEDIRRRPGEPIELILASRSPGVEITRAPDGGITIRIRGITSVNAGNDPLFVLDGIPLDPGPGGSLQGISPYDIETIEVLRDPAATAQYGVRGAAGVVLITTKRP